MPLFPSQDEHGGADRRPGRVAVGAAEGGAEARQGDCSGEYLLILYQVFFSQLFFLALFLDAPDVFFE